MSQGQTHDQTIEDRIRDRAYAIWESEGRPEGRAAEHWRRAEDELATSGDGRIDPDRAAEAAPGPRVEGADLASRQEQLIDEALEETFPGSDPIAPKQIT